MDNFRVVLRDWLELLVVAGIVGMAATFVVYLAGTPEARFTRPGQTRALQRSDMMLQFFSYSRTFIQYDMLLGEYHIITPEAMRKWNKKPRFMNWMGYEHTSELQRVQVAVGFPFRCAACAYDRSGRVFGGRAIGTMANPAIKIVTNSDISNSRVFFNNPSKVLYQHASDVPVSRVFFNNPSNVLCLTPLSAGIAANVSFYAIAFLIVRKLGRALVSRIRSSRGRCRDCGYDLAGTSQVCCPECGQSVSATAPE